MRLATWNLQSDHALPPEREQSFRAAMQDVNADVWVLTETWIGWSPGEGYTLVAESSVATDLLPWPRRRWVAIWVKSSLNAAPLWLHSQPDRMACARIVLPNGRGLVVVGTVLPWLADEFWPGSVGFCAALGMQSAEWGDVRGMKWRDTLAVAGDFNQSLPHQPHYGFAAGEAALNAALTANHLDCLTPGNDEHTAKPRIDHICVNCNGFDCSSLPTPGTWPIPILGAGLVTDHSGVYVDLPIGNV